MRLAVLKERRAAETRVAATPDTVKKLIGLGLTVAVEAGAGANASFSDADFAAAGAEIAADAAAVLAGAGIVFAVQTPGAEERALIPRGALLVCIAGAFADPDLVPSLAPPGSIPRRWSCCRGSPGHSRWMCYPARRISLVIARSLSQPLHFNAAFL